MAEATTRTTRWIRRFHPAPDARTRLICFPHAGGSASYYFPVSRSLAPDVDVLAVQYPGRQDRYADAFVDDIHRLAELVAAELDDELLDRPVALFGHSMGATVAFEVALLLQQQGRIPVTLFASGRRAPSRHRDERVHETDDEAIVAELVRIGGTDGGLLDDEGVLDMILPVIRNDYRAAESYRYRAGERLRCPVVALTGDNDPYVTTGEARAWQEHTSAAFDLRVLPGGHFFLADRAAEVLEIISEQLARALSAPAAHT
ncbi:thioesterase II family protein [Streptomyces populi]|jgi:surfactin synthase thioesterase subunit